MNEEQEADDIQEEEIDVEDEFDNDSVDDFIDENDDDLDWDDYDDEEYEKSFDDIRDSASQFRDYLAFLEKSMKIMGLKQLEEHWIQVFPNGITLFRFLQEIELASDSLMQLRDELSDSESI